MHAVGLQLVHQIGAVVEDECRTGLAAHVAYRASRFDDRLRGRILHAQLYPAAPTFNSHLHLFGDGIFCRFVGYEL